MTGASGRAARRLPCAGPARLRPPLPRPLTPASSAFPSKIIAVGDSLQHDIKGAWEWEIDSAFITTGIHCDDLHSEECALTEDMWCDAEELERLCAEHNADPTICAEIFGLGEMGDDE